MALQAIVVNPAEQILLTYSPTRKHGWQVVSGAQEAKETILDETLREVYEELGAEVCVCPLGVVHFHDSTNLWVLRRAVQLFGIWHEEKEPRLQQPL